MERLMLKEIYDFEILSCGKGFGSKERPALIAALSGTIQAVAGKEIFALNSEEALLIPPHTFFAVVEPKKEASFLSLSFEAEGFSLEEAALHHVSSQLIESIARPLQKAERYPLLELLLLRSAREDAIAPLKRSGSPALFFEAVGRMEQNLLNAPSVETLAEELGISLSKLKRIFARFSGMGAHEYLTDRRIALAKQYLREGRSVTETAALCGFANQAYFSAAFKKMVGCSPKEYLPKPAPESTPRPRAKKPAAPKRKTDMPSYLL